MPRQSFRFVQASDLHLEQPLQGLAEVPEGIRAALLDAPYTAAERVFDTALAETADFLLLAGDVLNARLAGPRGLVFLLEQFERLAARDITVYWAGGKEDPPDLWPPAVKLPPNVHVFSTAEVEALTHFRHEEPICRVAGMSHGRGAPRWGDFLADENGLFSVAVAYGRFEAEALARQPIEYWALGGNHARSHFEALPGTVHYSGTPQGRAPAEAGAHGCSLVSIDAEGQIRAQFVATDAVRWYVERLNVSEQTSLDELRRALAERARAIATECQGRLALVTWNVELTGVPSEKSRWLSGRANVAAELVGWLRAEFGGRGSGVYTTALEFEPPANWPRAWCEEDTILGDYLRAVQLHETDGQQPLDLAVYLSPSQKEGELATILAVQDAATRRRALREAAALGMELLRGNS